MENIKQWHEDAKVVDEDDEPVNPEVVEIWEKVLNLIRVIFQEGGVPKVFCHD